MSRRTILVSWAVAAVAVILIGTVWLIVTLISPTIPSTDTVESATGLDLPESAEIRAAKLDDLTPGQSGDQGTVEFTLAADDLETFISDNDLPAPVVVGDVPDDRTQATLQHSCDNDACYDGDVLIGNDIRINLRVTIE
ncbi:hypothetical protein [Haloglycomyces albus]|uniref:hypothetical protein n=1 Tax=Haloglycomyces albus TaxID=526067 RepID=UPI00046D2BAD|nr:hypothetical protein [Haloglycomyces albus]